MARIKMYIFNVKLPFYPPCEVKCELQNRVSTPPSLFRQKGVIKMSQIVKTHTAYYFGLCQLTPSDPMDFPSIAPLTPPKLLYHYLNVITKPQW